jgi:hypothetical protein
MSFCLETYLRESEEYRILITQAGFKDCAKLIEKEAKKVVHVQAGVKILGARIIGIPPIPIGYDTKNSTIMLPYTKPCYGTAVVELPVPSEELEDLLTKSID